MTIIIVWAYLYINPEFQPVKPHPAALLVAFRDAFGQLLRQVRRLQTLAPGEGTGDHDHLDLGVFSVEGLRRTIGSMYGRLMLTWLGYIDGKWHTIYGIHTDPMGKD